MCTLSREERQLVEASVGLIETDAETFTQNLMRFGGLTAEQARMIFQKALNAKAIREDRGRVWKAPPPADPRGLSAVEVAELERAGYSVSKIVDMDPPVFGWRNAMSGAAQSEHKALQPFRSTKAQAWVDCKAYANLEVTKVADPDWND